MSHFSATRHDVTALAAGQVRSRSNFGPNGGSYFLYIFHTCGKGSFVTFMDIVNSLCTAKRVYVPRWQLATRFCFYF